jgi:hypothetical protein
MCDAEAVLNTATTAATNAANRNFLMGLLLVCGSPQRRILVMARFESQRRGIAQCSANRHKRFEVVTVG